MKIFDLHTHIFPDPVAQKASDSISQFYDLIVRENGTLSRMIEESDEAGITRTCIHSVAVNPAKVRTITEYLARCVAAHPNRLMGFLSLHPDTVNPKEEIERGVELGLRGVKLHPDMQKFALDEPRSLKLFEAIAASGLPVLVHAGDHRFPYSNPKRIAVVCEHFPEVPLICAHLGGWSEWQEAREILPKYHVYVDTSSSLGFLSSEEAEKSIRAFGTDHVFLGTDYPMWRAGEELALFQKISLTESERADILWNNAKRFFDFSD